MFNLDNAENSDTIQLVNDISSKIVPNQLNNYNQLSQSTNIFTPELTATKIITPGVDEIILPPVVAVDITNYPESQTEIIPNPPETDPLTGITTVPQRIASQINPTPQFDNDLINARNIGVLSGNQVLSDSVGNYDPVDYYRFELNTTSNFDLFLSGLSSDADVALLQDHNNNGFVDFGETIELSLAAGNISEEINLSNLSPGTYYVEVSQYSGDTNYDLSLSATPTLNSGGFSGFSSTYGYGLVDANAAVAQTIYAPTPFPEILDLNDWDVEEINAPEVWSQGYTGQGIVVAVIDSGVDYNHFELAGNIWTNTDEIPNNGVDDDGNGYIDDIRGWDIVNNDNDPMDFDGHGTHIAGTIAAQENGIGITGIAPNAQIMPVKIGNFGDFLPINSAAGIYYAVDNGADVINLSFGGFSSSSIEDDAIRYATERGVVVVMAAGNEGLTFPGYPARNADRWGIAVGATDITGRIYYASNYAGSTPLDYVVAPGVDIYSTQLNDSFSFRSGTSMATPHVAGVAALVLSANPSLTSEQVEYIITTTANPNQVIA